MKPRPNWLAAKENHQRRFLELRRNLECQMFHWVGYREATYNANLGKPNPDGWPDPNPGEFERLWDCRTGADLVAFYLETATPVHPKVTNWHAWSMKDRWHWLRRSASPWRNGGTWTEPDGLIRNLWAILDGDQVTPRLP